MVVPAEKGMKASLLSNLPSLSRKWEGLKVCGVSHSFSSYRTEARRGNTVVPWTQKQELLAWAECRLQQCCGLNSFILSTERL